MPRPLPEQQETVPIPDPTALTIEALKTAIQNLKELTFLRISELEKSMNDKIGAVNTLKEEKFKELHERLAMVERHRVEAKQDNDKALTAALTASETLFNQKQKCNEEAAAKAEAFFTKQIEAISNQSKTEREALSARVDVLERYFDRGEGKEEHKGESRQQSSWMIPMLVVGALALINLALNVITMLSK